MVIQWPRMDVPPSPKSKREEIRAWEDEIKRIVQFGAYNTMELCRIANGHHPEGFGACYEGQKFDINRRGPRCNSRKRGCKLDASTCDGRLRRLQKRRGIKSLLITWFDGRPGRNENEIPTDKFRFWFNDRSGLGRRLIEDIESRLM